MVRAEEEIWKLCVASIIEKARFQLELNKIKTCTSWPNTEKLLKIAVR